ncbi:hypothetical protein ROZALSC1DRAFT_21039 [Rozella allomycis CSF55]|uniref:Uncharacterized protein n=1 Tax=Rozella allomycis (strain CSF55) TaxID=988480 RepID=A0A4P9YMC2_ROZAC|nr:hypothetical protein ROZALSC1DRAFT_21039 [Rozella allomycis CSF55]
MEKQRVIFKYNAICHRLYNSNEKDSLNKLSHLFFPLATSLEPFRKAQVTDLEPDDIVFKEYIQEPVNFVEFCCLSFIPGTDLIWLQYFICTVLMEAFITKCFDRLEAESIKALRNSICNCISNDLPGFAQNAFNSVLALIIKKSWKKIDEKDGDEFVENIIAMNQHKTLKAIIERFSNHNEIFSITEKRYMNVFKEKWISRIFVCTVGAIKSNNLNNDLIDIITLCLKYDMRNIEESDETDYESISILRLVCAMISIKKNSVFRSEERVRFLNWLFDVIINGMTDPASIKGIEGISVKLTGELFEDFVEWSLLMLDKAMNTNYNNDELIISLLKLLSKMSLNKSQRLSSARHPYGIFFLKQGSSLFNTSNQSKNDKIEYKIKVLKHSLIILRNLILGKYVDLRLPKLYGDSTFTEWLKSTIENYLSIPPNEFLGYKILCETFCDFMEYFIQDYFEELNLLPKPLISSLLKHLTFLFEYSNDNNFLNSSLLSIFESILTKYLNSLFEKQNTFALKRHSFFIPKTELFEIISSDNGFVIQWSTIAIERILMVNCNHFWGFSRVLYLLILIYPEIVHKVIISACESYKLRYQDFEIILNDTLAEPNKTLETVLSEKEKEKFTQKVSELRSNLLGQ